MRRDRDLPPKTFQDLAMEGTSIAAAPVERADLEKVVGEVETSFGRKLNLTDEAYASFTDRIRFAAGSYWDHTEVVDRRSVSERLNALAGAVTVVQQRLTAGRTGLAEEADLQVANLLRRAIRAAHPDGLVDPNQELGLTLHVIDSLNVYCDQARKILAHAPAKKGQRGLGWYPDYLVVTIRLAEHLGIAITTAGDRTGEDDESPYRTPFTLLVYRCEAFLPKGAQSTTLATCAWRIDQALKILRQRTRGNAP